MDECFDWFARQGRWVEVGLIAAMVLVALFSFKLMVSAAARVIVFIVSVALLGGGFYCLQRIRTERRWITFRIEYRGRVVSAKGSDLRKGLRCGLEVDGRFQWFQAKDMEGVAPRDLKVRASIGEGGSGTDKSAGKPSQARKGARKKAASKEPGVSTPSSDVESIAGHGSISAECRLKLTCGDDQVMNFGPEGKCLYFHHEGRIEFASKEGESMGFKLKGNRAEITSTSTERKQEKVILRFRRTEIRKPVL